MKTVLNEKNVKSKEINIDLSCVVSTSSYSSDQSNDNNNVEHREKGQKESYILNLSEKELTVSQEEILNKGLKFCPTQSSVDMAEVRKDLDNFHNSLELNTIG